MILTTDKKAIAGKKLSGIILFLLCGMTVFSQTDSVKTMERFSNLKDGIYFTYDELKNNTPTLLRSSLFKSVSDTVFSIQSWSNTENLFYLINSSHYKVNRDSLWGFVEKGTPFIFMGGRFHKMSTIGAICVFNESYPALTGNSLVVTEIRGSVTQRIFDFETGRVGDYDIDNLIYIFLRDEDLLKEFEALKTEKQKRRLMYKFIEKYNERHPLF